MIKNLISSMVLTLAMLTAAAQQLPQFSSTDYDGWTFAEAPNLTAAYFAGNMPKNAKDHGIFGLGESWAQRAELFDTATGMANAMHFVRSDGKEIVVGTNREIDEVAYYIFSE